MNELPGIVVRKWHEKKKRMQLLVDKELGDLTEEDMQRRHSQFRRAADSAFVVQHKLDQFLNCFRVKMTKRV